MRDQRAIDRRIATIAARQEGVIDHGQLVQLGLSPQAIGRRLDAGSLHPEHRGVYAVGHPVLSVTGRWWAGVRACGAGAALSDASAAAAWGLRRSANAVIHVTVPSTSGRRGRAGLHVHRRSLPADEITTLGGLPITTPARTLIDLAAGGLRGRPLEAALDHAELVLRIDWAEPQRLVERHAGRPGVSILSATLAQYAPGSVDTRSRLEEIVLELCDDSGLPRPLVNVVIEGRMRDFYWPASRLVVEADSYRWHRSPSALDDDRERDVQLTLAGYISLRFTYIQCTTRRDYVRRSILAVLVAL